MIHKEYDKYIYDLALKRAVNWLIELEIKRGILINGNFSKAAEIYGCKVRDVRAKYNSCRAIIVASTEHKDTYVQPYSKQ